MPHNSLTQYLIETPVSRNSSEMDEYYGGDNDFEPGSKEEQDTNKTQAAAPYFVGWSGQYLEWYGDDDMKKGRYKAKGDGGDITAINVQTYEQAQQLADALDAKYQDGTFDDDSVYNKHGEDMALVQYHGAFLESMSEFGDEQKRDVKYQQVPPKDFSGDK